MGESKSRAAARAASIASAPSTEEYALVELRAAIPLPNGGEGHKILVYRPTCKQMTEILDTPKLNVQIERFGNACCRALNGSGEPMEFSANDLNSIDGTELSTVITAMSEDAEAVQLEETGDGIETPFIYTLKRPIKLSPQIEDGETLYQFSFEARRIGDITEYLDARGERSEFYTFMRVFGKPLALRIPVMTEALIGAIDFLDYLVLRRQVLPRFLSSPRRWKRVSSPAH